MIIRFDDQTERRRFLERAQTERQDILEHCRLARTRPDLVVSPVSSEQAAWIEQALSGTSRAFDDVAMRTFGT